MCKNNIVELIIELRGKEKQIKDLNLQILMKKAAVEELKQRIDKAICAQNFKL